MKEILLAGLIGLTGCSSIPKEREVYHLPEIRIILDTERGVNASYQNYTGHQFPEHKVAGFEVDGTIYCRHNDFYTLGHELMHVIKGEFHDEE